LQHNRQQTSTDKQAFPAPKLWWYSM
jgi:hypothetical protein